MTQTDRILSNIGAIKTLLENFPMGLFERDGKTYTSSFEFIMDVLRSCGISDQTLISYIIGKIYGFEGQAGYTINGLYESVKRGEINVDMQNPFILGLETSIKSILMALFTSIYTCSALPILPNRVFDYDSLPGFMDYNVEALTRRSTYNDSNFKMKIPISTIDMIGMLSISPTTSEGSLYYLTNGHDNYYKKESTFHETPYTQYNVNVSSGESYSAKVSTYDSEYALEFKYEFGYMLFETSNGRVVPTDLTVNVDYLYGDMDATITATFIIPKNESSSNESFIQTKRIHGNDEYPTEILGITINGNKKGCEVGNQDDGLGWCYLTYGNSIYNWDGVPINSNFFGESRSENTRIAVKVAESDITTDVESIMSSYTYSYKSIKAPTDDEVTRAIRYTYIPNQVYENDPDIIVCFEGMNPNLVYQAYDMNAFIWYCYNRNNVSNQIEQNHLMWDSRISASKNGLIRSGGQWNVWYNSKAQEGDELEYNENRCSDVIYPIIQIEKYNEYELLVRIPSQRYFLPNKRKEMYDGTYEPGKTYFNASIYKFDWDYLKNIQILNPKLLLVRLVENLIGFTMDVASSVQFNVNKKRIEAVLSKAVKSIITANDMEIEDCWKSFSNEDYNDLLDEMLLSRYTSSKTNLDSSNIRVYDVNEYINQLDKISSSVTSQGTKTMITKTVTNIMMTDGSEKTTEYSFDYGFDSNMLSRLIWAVVMPIVESLFTPQVMLLMMINFQLLGIVNVDGSIGNDFTKVLNLLLNKILGLVKSIVIYIKDKIISLLLELFNEVITPLLTNMMLMLYLEMITDWLVILLNAVRCIPLMLGIDRTKPIGYIEDVDYADIVNEQTIPESSSEC